MSSSVEPMLMDVEPAHAENKNSETRYHDNTDSSDTRLNVRLPSAVRKSLDWIASARGISAVEAIRRAIGTEKFFLELKKQHAKIFVQIPGEKNYKEVIFKD